jgi:AcrR family transcriptional regulator
MTDKPMSGRRAQAARNDTLILQAARDVFVADPEAPIADVAKKAGVGISALYRRYPSKEDLLRKLCSDGLARYAELTREAVEADGDVWDAFRGYMRGVVIADTPAFTINLAGKFTPTPDMYAAASEANELNHELLAKAKGAGVLRPDADLGDLAMMTESVSTIHVGDAERTMELRLRYLELYLQALHAPGSEPLPATGPSVEELSARWEPHDAT